MGGPELYGSRTVAVPTQTVNCPSYCTMLTCTIVLYRATNWNGACANRERPAKHCGMGMRNFWHFVLHSRWCGHTCASRIGGAQLAS